MQERLQKILSQQGVASRRKAEEYIERGLIKVNGTIATLGDKADPEVDIIEVEGTVLKERAEMKYYVLFKPMGVECTNIPGRGENRTVFDLLPEGVQGELYPVGRLDKDSSGLLIITNDGVLAYRLTHPKFHHEKEYLITTKDIITDSQLDKMRKGLNILGSKTKEAAVEYQAPTEFTITLTEGKNRQIRRMVQKVGGEVRELERIRICSLGDSALHPGEIRELTETEVKGLMKAVGMQEV